MRIIVAALSLLAFAARTHAQRILIEPGRYKDATVAVKRALGTCPDGATRLAANESWFGSRWRWTMQPD